MRLWEGLETAGRRSSASAPMAARALMSLRLEKGWGVWGLEYRPDYTAAMSGLDAFIDWRKEFIGKAAALAERETGPTMRLVTMTVETDQDVVGDEAILQGDTCIGHVTSGGYAHHGKTSVAMGYVDGAYAEAGTALLIEIGGQMRKACVLGTPLHDPDGLRMRE